jgi:2-methylcitrate dehydratase PrpD
VAVALVEGAAGERQYSDRAVRDPQVVALRSKVTAIVDPAIKPEQVDMTITLADGRQLHKFIAHAIGSLEVPMTDAQLEAKFRDLADGILPATQVDKLIATCWNVTQLGSASAIAQAARKGG